MPGKRSGQISVLLFLSIILVGLAGGVGLGLWIGWVAAPVEYIDTDMAYLHPTYQDDLILMIGEAFALDHNLDAARARLDLLMLDDPANAIADRAEKAIAQQPSASQTLALARLALALGAQRDTLTPYRDIQERVP